MVKYNCINYGKHCSLFSFIYRKEWLLQRRFRADEDSSLGTSEYLELGEIVSLYSIKFNIDKGSSRCLPIQRKVKQIFYLIHVNCTR